MSGSRFSFLATDPDSYEHFMGRWSARLANPFLDFAAIQPGTRVLDLGCGTGVLSVALAERGCTVVGIDASEAYLDGARRHPSHPLVTYEVGDGQRLSHADGSFDSCVSTLAIDVVPEIESFAAEMRRVTRPGGVVASNASRCCRRKYVMRFAGTFDLVISPACRMDPGPLRGSYVLCVAWCRIERREGQTASLLDALPIRATSL
jgi:2-polyprenyl-3-methyl-5-hydroxy-6-metoxy-1,4-benzoquinol methylase